VSARPAPQAADVTVDAAARDATNTRRLPAVWILSLPWLTYGVVGGFVIVTLPQMLAAQAVPGGRIAMAVGIIISPLFWNFALAPFLDVRFRRRTYALVFGALAVAASALTVIQHTSLAEVEPVMTVGMLSLCLFQAAVGGWLGSLIPKEHDSRLGAWSTVYSSGGNGAGILIAGYATEHLSQVAAAALIFVVFLAPLLVFPLIPAPAPRKLPASESFSRFAREAALLLKRREVFLALPLLALPSASFALTNALGGWSGSFHASPSSVSIISGVGVIVGTIAGCSLVPPIARKLPLRPLYLCIGFLGAAFTLSLLVFPRVPAIFGLAFVGENFFQAAALATAISIIFEVIGPGNPLAATTFALLTSALCFPIDYMQFVDARAYDWLGITGAFLADAIVSGAACILLALVLRRQLLPPPPAVELARDAIS
jgi:MFS transporter, PAT family, beta-lactamase induction signal transducer AmpG